jgi:hypothetical protein
MIKHGDYLEGYGTVTDWYRSGDNFVYVCLDDTCKYRYYSVPLKKG